MGWEPGSLFENLEILDVLGRGSFGRVLLANDRLLRRKVALKVVERDALGGGRTLADRSLREAQLIGQLEHPHVVRLYRVHQTGEGDWAIEMEYLDGGTLQGVLDLGGPVLPSRGIEIGHAVASGLAAAHAKGIVHGDVKPSNVLLGRDGTIKLADFGIAAIAQESAGDSDRILGTPRFMSPEVFLGGSCTPASDAWSLGVILYQLLSGSYPFPTEHMGSLFHAIQNVSVAQLTSPVPPRVSDVVAACLDRDPRRRPPLQEVRDALGDPTGPRDPSRGCAAPAVTIPVPIGRDAEHRTILGLVRRASKSGFAGLLLQGEPGIGKSYLMRSVAAHASAADCDWLTLRADPAFGILPAVAQAVHRASGSGTSVSREFERASAEIRSPRGDGRRFESRQQVTRYLGDLLRSAARRRTIGILIEDVHRAEPDELSLLLTVGSSLSDERVFLALTERTAGSHDSSITETRGAHTLGFEEAEQWRVLELDPLGSADIYAILEAASYRVDPRVGRRAAAIAEGNPLFALELMRHFVESGVVESVEGSWQPGPTWDERALPRRVRDLVSMRLQGLKPDERELLEFASAEGESFDAETLAAILELPILAVLRRLQRVYQERRLVVPSRDRFRFGHAVVREALYEELSPALRAEIHRRLAVQLEAGASADSERLGRHWHLAGESDKARPYLLHAAASAGRRQEIGRMIELCTHAGITPESVPPELPPGALETYIDLAFCYSDAGHEKEARMIFDALEGAAVAAGDDELLLRIRVRKAKETFFTEGAGALDLDLLERAARTLPVGAELGTAHYVLCLVRKYAGDLDGAEAHASQALEIYESIGKSASASDAYDQLGSIALRRGRLDEARAHYLHAEKLSAQEGRDTNAAISAGNAGLVSFQQGQLDDAAEILGRSIARLRVGGAGKAVSHAQVLLARVEIARGNLAGAGSLLEEAGSALAETEHLPALAALRIAVAGLAQLRGDWDRLDETLSQLRDETRLSGNRAALLRAGGVELVALVMRGELSRARELDEALLRDAREIDENTTQAGLRERIAEAVLFGHDPARLDAWHAVGGDLPAYGAALEDLARAATDASRPPGDLGRAARTLRDSARADRAAYLKLLADAVGGEDSARTENAARAAGFVPLAERVRDLAAGPRT